jgi:hypothetical protein
VFTGSSIGNRAMTQHMLLFCGEHNIVADVEVWSAAAGCVSQGGGARASHAHTPCHARHCC